MGATNQTPYLGLPQYVDTDKPSWLTDINAAMLAIDEALSKLNDQMGVLNFESELTRSGNVIIIEDQGTNFGPRMVRNGRVYTLYFTKPIAIEGGEILKWAHADGDIFGLGSTGTLTAQFNTLDVTGGDTHIPGGNVKATFDPVTRVTVFDLTDMPTTPAAHAVILPAIFVRSDYNVCN